jgi:hypothetical protein
MKKLGSNVIFAKKVYEPPYAPYYDAYKGQVFQIIAYHDNYTHVEVECISDPSIKVAGYVHPNEIINA